jgi:hypothetical protein
MVNFDVPRRAVGRQDPSSFQPVQTLTLLNTRILRLFSGPGHEAGYRGSKGDSVVTCRIWAGALALVFAAASAFAQRRSIRRTHQGRLGSVFIVRAGTLVPAQAGQEVFEADGLKTGADGRLGITLNRRTTARLPWTEQRSAGSIVRIRAGRRPDGIRAQSSSGASIGYVSGRIAKLSRRLHSTRDAAAVVGVRGTTLALTSYQNDPRATSAVLIATVAAGAVGLRPPVSGPRRVPARTWSSCCRSADGAVGRAVVSTPRDRPSSPPHESTIVSENKSPAPVVVMSEADAQQLLARRCRPSPPRQHSTSPLYFSFRVG